MQIKISSHVIDYAKLDEILNENENLLLSAPEIVSKYSLDVSAITVSKRRKDTGLEWDRYLGKSRATHKRNYSVLKKTKCKCPKCSKNYHVMSYYTGRGVYRRFCDYCKNAIDSCQWPELPEPVVSHRIAMAI